MSEPNLQPLAALLASHPEECAAVVAVLAAAEWNCPGGISVSRIRELTNTQDDGERMLSILRAVVAAGLAQVNTWCEYRVGSESVAVGIARMGAAAWLRARVAPSVPRTTNPQNIGAARLCALGIEAAEIGALWGAAIAVKIPFPRTIGEYHDRLAQVAEQIAGLPMTAIDVDREVAAVWGERETGAQAPKGERR